MRHGNVIAINFFRRQQIAVEFDQFQGCQFLLKVLFFKNTLKIVKQIFSNIFFHFTSI